MQSCAGPGDRTVELSCSVLPPSLQQMMPCAGPDRLFVRVHDAVRHFEGMVASQGDLNGFHGRLNGREERCEGQEVPLLPRSSIDCV